jgi:hypothetical protein
MEFFFLFFNYFLFFFHFLVAFSDVGLHQQDPERLPVREPSRFL